MTLYYALANDGRIYNLCDCGNFEEAEHSAQAIGIDPIWIADETTAKEWRTVLETHNRKDRRHGNEHKG